jgi:Stress responsive A/B Barrel Domain
MIRHIVLIKFKPETSENEIKIIFLELDRIRSEISGMGTVHSGRSESPEHIERGFMHGFTLDFQSWDGLSAYQNHPKHQATGAKIVAAAVGGIDGILVFDFEF